MLELIQENMQDIHWDRALALRTVEKHLFRLQYGYFKLNCKIRLHNCLALMTEFVIYRLELKRYLKD